MNKMVNKTLTCCPPGAYFLVLVVTLIHVDLYSQWLHKKNSAQRCTWESPSPTVFHHQLSTGLWSYGTIYYPRPNPFLLRQLVIGASRWGHGGVGWGEGVCVAGIGALGCEPQAFGSFGDQTKQWAKTSGLGTHPGTGPWHYCCYSVTQLRQTFCDPLNGTTPGFQSFTISRSLLKFMSIESVMLSNHLFLCHLLLLLPLIFPSIRVFFQGFSSSHQVVKVLEFRFQHQSFQWIFRVNFL